MRIPRRITALAAAGVLALSLSACGSPAGDAASGTCPGGKVRFGVEPYEDPEKLKPAYEVLAQSLEKKLDCPVELQVVSDYSAEVLAMRNGKLELAQFGPLGFVFASQKAGAEPVVSFADAKGKLTTYTAGIWVAKDSPIKSAKDLRGKSLALSEASSTSGGALPRYALKEAGVDEKSVKIDYAGGHPEAMLALKNGKVDAAEINSQTLATAGKSFDRTKFRKIWTSDAIPNDPITLREDLDPAFKDKVRKALLDLSPQDIAKVGAFLDVSPPGPLAEVDKDTYRPLFELAKTLGLTEEDV